MKFIIKVSKYSLLYCCITIMFTAIPITASAQDVVDTSSPYDHLVKPTIVLTPSVIEPDCHTYTGCGLVVVKKYYYQQPKHYKHKRHRYHPPCCYIGDCYVRPMGQYW